MSRKRATGRGKRTRKAPLSFRIFISHATADKFIAVTVCEKLDKLGMTTFRDDRDINGGDSIPETIKREIIACDEFVVVLTPQSVNRQWVLLEIGTAWGWNKRIVPLLYGLEPEQIPDIISDRRGFNLNELDKYLADLSKRLRKS